MGETRVDRLYALVHGSYCQVPSMKNAGLKTKNHNNREQIDWEVQSTRTTRWNCPHLPSILKSVFLYAYISERRNRSAGEKKFVIFKKPLAITYVSATLGDRFNTTACYQNIY